MRSSRYLPVLTLGILALVWGYSWVPSKLGIGESGAFVFAALRTLPAGLLMLGLLPLLGRPQRLWRSPVAYLFTGPETVAAGTLRAAC